MHIAGHTQVGCVSSCASIWPKLRLGATFLGVSHTHTHTHTPSRIVLNEWSARRRNCYLHNKYKKPTFKPSAGYEPAIPAIVHLQTTPRQHGHRDRSLARISQRLWSAVIRYVHLSVFVGYSSPRVTFQLCVCLLSIRPARLYFSLYSSTCCQSS